MDIRYLASILLALHLISGVFIALVIKRQWGLFKDMIDHSLLVYRKVLFALSCVIFLGNLNPILINLQTILFGPGARPAKLQPISISYAVSNAVVAMISAILIFILYKMAADATSKKDN